MLKIHVKFGFVQQNSFSGSGLGFYSEFQYQSYYLCMEDEIHEILFGIANYFKTYCVYGADAQTDRRIFFSSRTYQKSTSIKKKGFCLEM